MKKEHFEAIVSKVKNIGDSLDNHLLDVPQIKRLNTVLTETNKKLTALVNRSNVENMRIK